MTYKKLRNFQPIFNRKDFDYISDHNKITEIESIIRHNLSNPTGRDQIYIRLLEEFRENVTTFYQSIAGHNIPHLKKGYLVILEELQRYINIFSEPEFKRRSLSRGYCRKFNKTFLYGLSQLLDGIRAAFDPDIVSSVKIDTNQYIRYILDRVEGLGKKFLFNRAGRHAFVNKVGNLTMQELVVTVRFLTRPPWNQIRTINGWRDLGLKQAPIRILSEHKLFGKDKVYFLYTLNEHGAYDDQLRVSPDRMPFSAAA